MHRSMHRRDGSCTESQKGRFLLCLSNIVDHSGDGKVKNGVIMLTLGYKIPF